MVRRAYALAIALFICSAGPSAEQDQPVTGPSVSVCGLDVPPPRGMPPAGSPPVVLNIVPCFEAQGGTSVIEPQTYVYYIQLKPSTPSQGTWINYDATSEKTILEDFHRLWNTNFLDNL